MKKGRLAWIAYRKMRPALGIPFAFVLLSGLFMGFLDFTLIVTALGLMLIDLFGNLYNDYWDYSEDLENKRGDKLTTSGLASLGATIRLSIVFGFAGLLLLAFASFYVMLLGVLYAVLLVMYSHPGVRLKGRVPGYSLVSLPYLFLPVALSLERGLGFAGALPLSFFFYFQCVYILCQKDSTDREDSGNIFKSMNWSRGSGVTAVFAALSSASLAAVAFASPVLVPALMLGIAAKALNVWHISRKTITRKKRGYFILAEFVSHYVAAGGLLA